MIATTYTVLVCCFIVFVIILNAKVRVVDALLSLPALAPVQTTGQRIIGFETLPTPTVRHLPPVHTLPPI